MADPAASSPCLNCRDFVLPHVASIISDAQLLVDCWEDLPSSVLRQRFEAILRHARSIELWLPGEAT